MREREKPHFDVSLIPEIPTQEYQTKALEYVSMVYEGYTKKDAYKAVFPERYQNLKDKCEKYKRNFNVTFTNYICRYEDGKYVTKLYSLANEQYYKRFIDKRTKLLDKLYEIGMDDDEKMSHRLVASKTFLSSTPEPEKKITHKIEGDVKIEFRNKLEQKQKELYAIANGEDIEDVIVVDNGDRVENEQVI
jgi:DNA-binding transcriptional regulator PaaX